mmetsp:Transcript_34212/g.54613  ORF Transcript_34212/g.54613 Transcript_34212/m.54613 type:complete len:552 (-) Transcript_34212:45-1700(-)
MLSLFAPRYGHDANAEETGFLQEMEALTVCFSFLAIMCGLTLIVRTWASWNCKLQLACSHISFLFLTLLLSVLRVVDFQWLPSRYVMRMGTGLWLKNLLSLLPMLLFLTVFALLLYHVIIILHSIHLAYDPLFRSLEDFSSPPESLRQSFVSRKCSYWFTLHGRPHSTCKWVLIICFAILWFLFGLIVVVDWSSGYDESVFFYLLAYFMELPTIIVSSGLGICFIVSGVALVRRLNQLSTFVVQEDPGSVLRMSTRHRAGSNFERPSSVSPSLGQRHISGVSGDFLIEQEWCMQVGTLEQGDTCNVEGNVGDAHVFDAPRASQAEACALEKDSEGVSQGLSSDHPFYENALANRNSPGVGSLRRLQLPPLQGDRSGGRRTIHSAISSQLSWTSPLHSASEMSLPALQDDIFDRIASIETVLQGARKMLAVVFSCVVAFLWRSACLALVSLKFENVWPKGFLFFYLLLAEVVPIFLFVTLYLLPGLQAMCWSNGSIRPSVVESMILPLPQAVSFRRTSAEGSGRSPCSSPSLRHHEIRSSHSGNSGACFGTW